MENFRHEWEVKQAKRAADAATLAAQHPHLVSVAKNKGNSLTAAAKNIRIELARAFPGVAFSVKTSRFSMGDSIDIRWTDGPTAEQVENISDKYAAGSFDGMTECYNYASCAWTDAFGDAKFVHTTREHSDRFVAAVLARMARYWGVEVVPSVEDFRQGRLRHVKANCSDFGSEVHRAMARHTCALTKASRCGPVCTFGEW